jgi:hypothetical protein
LTKTVPTQKSDQPSQMGPKVMDFFRILKFQLGRVVEDFKLNLLDLEKKWSGSEMESLVLKVLGSFQNYKFLDNWTSIGRFSFFCENRPVLVHWWCYENLIGSLVHIFFGLVRTNQVIKFFKLTRFSDKLVLIYKTTTDFHNLIIKFFIN